MTNAARRLSRSDLHARVWARPMSAVAADLGISRNGLAKVCDRLLVPYPGRGYWTKARMASPPPPPPLPDLGAKGAVAGADRSPARRRRTRLTSEARRAQLLDTAAAIVRREGAHAATMRRVTREAGISEAQGHNLFPRRLDLLTALARREIAAMNDARETEIARGRDSLSRVTLSTLAYLRQAAERGAVIQRLVDVPEVRAALRAERQARTQSARRQVSERLTADYGVTPDVAYGATAVLTAVCLRAGRLVAEGKIPLDMAERLSLAMVTAGNRAVAGRRAGVRSGGA